MADSPDFSAKRDSARIATLAAALGERERISDAQVTALARYVELVATWNRKLDLTAARGASAQVEVLLADSCKLAAEAVAPRGARCVDVGSGAGAPALPLALLRDDLTLTLVEPLRKRVAFLRTAVGSLGLAKRVRIVEAKLEPEQAPPAQVVEQGAFDLALSRATFAPELWLRAGTALAPRTLVLLAAQAAPEPPSGVSLRAQHDYTLPSSGAKRSIAVYERERQS